MVRRFAVTTALIVATVLAENVPAVAQTSRAEEIAQQQAAKSTQLRPNVPNRAEVVLDWLEDYLTDPNAVYVTFGGIYPSAGFAPGVAARRAAGGARFNIGGAYSVRNYKLAHVSLAFPDLLGQKLALGTTGRWTDATQVPFYGVGNNSSKDNRVSYGLRELEVEGTAALRPVSWYAVGAGIALRHIEDRAGSGTRPSIQTRHSPFSAPGLFAGTEYTQTTAFTGIDRRESPGYTRRGGFYGIAVHDFRERDDAFSFRRGDAEVQQFIPLLKEHWVLVFRALVQTTDVDSGEVVPYYLLPSLGGARMHRGYSDFRFQDKHLLLLSGEYRWTPSRVLDMAIFVDSGKVAAERRDLDFDRLKTAYGLGMRVHGPNYTALRLDIARGDEGIRVHITGGATF